MATVARRRQIGAASERQSLPDGPRPPGGQSSARSTTTGGTGHKEEWYDRMAGVIVAVVGLLVLLGIMLVAMVELPNGTAKGTNIVALASAGFGVIGAVVGAFFGVRAANRAVNRVTMTRGHEGEE